MAQKPRNSRHSPIKRSDDRGTFLDRMADYLESVHGKTPESERLRHTGKNVAAINESDKSATPMIFSYTQGINLRYLDPQNDPFNDMNKTASLYGKAVTSTRVNVEIREDVEDESSTDF